MKDEQKFLSNEKHRQMPVSFASCHFQGEIEIGMGWKACVKACFLEIKPFFFPFRSFLYCCPSDAMSKMAESRGKGKKAYYIFI